MDVHPTKNVSIGIDPYPYLIHIMYTFPTFPTVPKVAFWEIPIGPRSAHGWKCLFFFWSLDEYAVNMGLFISKHQFLNLVKPGKSPGKSSGMTYPLVN